MALTSGFFNAIKSDRTYNAEQMSEIFDGVLKDGIIPSQGQLFAVTSADNGMQINVGTGRAWFHHTWTKNDSVMVMVVDTADATRSRIDAVVLEVNRSVDVRKNSIKIVKGEVSQDPQKPSLIDGDEVKQYPLAYITVHAAAESITASDIENMVGREPTVFATGVLESVSLDELWDQWKGDWETWFEGIKLQLTDDVVTNLQYQIEKCVKVADKATSGDVLNPVSDDKWMTPVRTKEMVEGITKERIGEVFSGSTNSVLESNSSIVPFIDARYGSYMYNNTYIPTADNGNSSMYSKVMHFNNFSIAYVDNGGVVANYCVYDTKEILSFGSFGTIDANNRTIIRQSSDDPNIYYAVTFNYNVSSSSLNVYKFTPTKTNPLAGKTMLGSTTINTSTNFVPCYRIALTSTHVYFVATQTNSNSQNVRVYAFSIAGGSPAIYVSSSLYSFNINNILNTYIDGNILLIHTSTSITHNYYVIRFDIASLTFSYNIIGNMSSYTGYVANDSRIITDHGIYVSFISRNSTSATASSLWEMAVYYIDYVTSSRTTLYYQTTTGNTTEWTLSSMADMSDGRALITVTVSGVTTNYILNKRSYSILSIGNIKSSYNLTSSAQVVPFYNKLVFRGHGNYYAYIIIITIDGAECKILDVSSSIILGGNTPSIFIDDNDYAFAIYGQNLYLYDLNRSSIYSKKK